MDPRSMSDAQLIEFLRGEVKKWFDKAESIYNVSMPIVRVSLNLRGMTAGVCLLQHLRNQIQQSAITSELG